MITVRMQDSGWTMTVDEGATLLDMQHAEARFFAKTHGSRETYTVHRGCLVVRYTTGSMAGGQVRRTATYIFGRSSESGDRILWNIDAGLEWVHDIRTGKRAIDTVLDQGWYTYGLHEPRQKPQEAAAR